MHWKLFGFFFCPLDFLFFNTNMWQGMWQKKISFIPFIAAYKYQDSEVFLSFADL